MTHNGTFLAACLRENSEKRTMLNQESKTILLVEDEAIIAIAEARTIRQFGYEVITANSGEKAVALATGEKKIDLLLMDIDLGKGISGPEAALQVLKIRTLPIVFLTSHSERTMVERVRGITRYGYVIKNSGDFVLQSSIEMAFELFGADQETREKESRLEQTQSLAHIGNWIWDIKNDQLVWSDKSVHTVWAQAGELIVDEEGNPAILTGFVQDITERKRSEEQLAKLNECFLQFGADPLVNINLLVATCGVLVSATCALYNRLQAGMLCSLGQWNTPPGYQSTDQPTGHICYDVIKADGDKTVVIRNLQDSSYVKSDPNVQLYALKTYIGKAVKFRGASVGSLCVVFQSDVIPSDKDMHLMEIVASAIGVEEERRHTEEVIHESEQRMSSIYDTVDDVIFHLEVESEGKYRFASVNTTFCNITGLNREQVIGKMVDEVIPEPSLTMVLEKYKQAINEKKIIRWEEVSDYPTGRLIGAVSIAPVVDDKGYCTHLIGSVHDITERKRAEEASHKIEEQFRLVWENSADGMRLTNEEGSILRVNEAFCRLVGKERFELEGKSLAVIYKKERQEHVSRRHMERFKSRTVETHFEREIILWNGKKIWIEVANSFLESEGQPSLLLGIFRDITERKQVESALRESEERYRSILNASPDDITISDLEGRILMISPAAATMFGYDRAEEQLGRLIIEFITPEDRERASSNIALMFQGIYTGPGEYRGVRANGDSFDIEVNSEFIRDAKGQATQMIFIVRDITDRRRVDKALRESEEKYRLIAEKTTDVIWLMSFKGESIYVSPSIERFTGYTVGEYLSQSFDDRFTKESAQIAKDRLFKELSRIGKNFDQLRDYNFKMELEYKCKNGTTKWGELLITSYCDEQGKIVGIHGATRDITERKRLEDDLHNDRHLLRTLIDNIPDAIYSKDLACRKTLANITEVRHTGRKSEAEVLGKDDFEFYPKELAEKFFADDQSVIQSGNPVLNREEYILDADEQKRWLLTSKLPWRDKDGQVIGLIGIGRDITERKRAEDRIRTLLEAKELLLKEVHHRIKNNMNMMISLLSLQTDSTKSGEVVAALSDAGNRMRSMLVLYDKLYRSENFGEVSVKEYLTLLTHEIVNNFPSRIRVKIKTQIDDFMLDAKRLSPLGIILNELFTNIIKYAFVGRAAGEIAVSASVKDARVTIVVQDDGVGIPETIDIATSGGFGFQLVDMLTNQLDGSIRIERGNGTKFILDFDV